MIKTKIVEYVISWPILFLFYMNLSIFQNTYEFR